MNALAMVQADLAVQIANERAAELHREADHNRLAEQRPRWGRLRQIAETVSALPKILTLIDGDRLVVPTLNDYPYRA